MALEGEAYKFSHKSEQTFFVAHSIEAQLIQAMAVVSHLLLFACMISRFEQLDLELAITIRETCDTYRQSKEGAMDYGDPKMIEGLFREAAGRTYNEAARLEAQHYVCKASSFVQMVHAPCLMKTCLVTTGGLSGRCYLTPHSLFFISTRKRFPFSFPNLSSS